jgi:hypothetical protein
LRSERVVVAQPSRSLNRPECASVTVSRHGFDYGALPMTICINLKRHQRPHKLPCLDCSTGCRPQDTIDLDAPTLEEYMHIAQRNDQ